MQAVPRSVLYERFPERQSSVEVDLGYDWHNESTTWPRWRVSWLQETGEVIATRMTDDPDPSCILLGRLPTEKDLKKCLGDWTRIIGTPEGSLEWIRSHINDWEFRQRREGLN